jgi:hypothetical protein
VSRSNFGVLTISISLFGLLWLISEFGIFTIGFTGAAAIASIFYGVASIFFSMNTGERAIILLGSIVFIAGVILLVITNYEVLSLNRLLLPGLFTSAGTGFFMLFIENSKDKTFLITAAGAFLLTYFSMSGIIPGFMIKLSGSFSAVIYSYSPIFLILFGIMSLISARNEAKK